MFLKETRNFFVLLQSSQSAGSGMELSLFTQLTLFTLCFTLKNHAQLQDNVQDNDENVIDLLEAVTRSVRGVTTGKGREPGAQAWRLRSRTPHLTLPQDFSRYLLSSSQGSLGLHLVGQQVKNSEATLISLSSEEVAQKLDGLPLLRLSSSTRDNWLRLEYRTQNSLKLEVLTFPGGNPFTSGDWVRVALNLEPRRLQLFVECKDVIVQELDEDRAINLELPLDLQVTFSSTAGNKTSKFNGSWQTAELSTKAYGKRPWLCDSKTAPLPAPTQSTAVTPVAHTSVEPEKNVLHDQPDHTAGTGLGPPGTSEDKVTPSEPAQNLISLEDSLIRLSTMVTMLKTQHEQLLARVQYLESCECVRRTSNDCNYNGRLYTNNAVFQPTPCTTCVCENGHMNCKDESCPSLSCLRTYFPHGACCPVCQPGCEYEDGVYADGDVFVSRSNPCLQCTCINSQVRCDHTHCPPTQCASPYTRSGECCPSCSACDLEGRPHNGSFTTNDGCQSCTCQNGEASCIELQRCPSSCRNGMRPPLGQCCMDCTQCEHEGEIFKDGMSFTDKRDPCKRCVCRNGNVQCSTESCPSLGCNLVETVGGECCPRCRSCFHKGTHHVHGSQWQDPEDGCSACTCTEGNIQCNNQGCNSPCGNPTLPPPPPFTGCNVNGVSFQNGEAVPNRNPCESCVCVEGQVRCNSQGCENPTNPPCDYSCTMEGVSYRHGESVPSRNPCERCICLNRQVQCNTQGCVNPTNPPTCCSVDGVSYQHGNPVPSRKPCEQCVCVNGNVQCNSERCVTPTNPPPRPCDYSCSVDGVGYQHGNPVPSRKPCEQCVCLNGNIQCNRDRCVNPTNAPPCDYSCIVNGVKYQSGNPVPGRNLCEQCVCMNGNIQCNSERCENPTNPPPRPCDYSCNVNGVRYQSGDPVPSGNVCERCMCMAGEVQCENNQRSCPPLLCTHPIRQPGQCCPTCDSCDYQGRVYSDGDVFKPPGEGPCLTCSCERGSVRCHDEKCPPVQCSNPIRDPHRCCPYCRGCALHGVQYEEGASWTSRNNPCEMCRCVDGTERCAMIACAPPNCRHPNTEPGSCCPSCDRCLFKQRIYENGDVFSDPERLCQTCICQGGSVKCHKEKCPPALCANPIRDPRSCCPVCRGCVSDEGVEYNEGDRWTVRNDPCRSCTCVGGAVQCSTAVCGQLNCLHPNTEPGACCPTCNHCLFKQHIYENSQTFTDPDESCRRCTCQDGTVRCDGTPQSQCPPVTCSNPRTPPGQCCPQCSECNVDNRVFVDGETFPNPRDSCEQCVCSGGNVDCNQQCSRPNCQYPVQGTCCPNNCNGCNYAGNTYPNGFSFPHPTDHCKDCQCMNGNVLCLMKRCPVLHCADPIVSPGQCCPQCPG